jgi:hypothetical protein
MTMGSKLTRARQAFNKFKQQKQDVMPAFEGVMGDGDGNVQVPGAGNENISYVRIGGAIQEVFNTRALLREGLRVLVGYDPSQPNLMQVLGTSSSAPLGTLTGESATLYAPATYYEWGGTDPIWIVKRLWLPRRISCLDSTDPAYTGLTVRLYPDMFWDGSAWMVLSSADIDLSDYLPTTVGKSAYTLITVDTSGAIVCTMGAEVDTAALDASDIPAVPDDTADALAAVALYYGQTEIQEAAGASDIVDLRCTYFGEGGTGVGTGDVIAPASATPGNIAVFGSDPQHIEDGGAPSGTGDVIAPASATTGHLMVVGADKYHYADGGAPGAGGGHTIEDEGTPLTARTYLDFAGAGVTVTDVSGSDKTLVTIPSGAGAALGSVWSPDAPLDSPNAKDDDFADSSLDGKWTHIGSTYTTSEAAHGWTASGYSGGGDYWEAIVQTVPDADWTIVAKVSLSESRQNYVMGGIILLFGSNLASSFNTFNIYSFSDTRGLKIMEWTNQTTWDADYYSEEFQLLTEVYLRLRFDRSENLIHFDASKDGIGYRELGTPMDISTNVVTKVGVGYDNNNGTYDARFVASWFRYKASYVEVSDVQGGNRVNLYK